jgi:hypothetical protein
LSHKSFRDLLRDMPGLPPRCTYTAYSSTVRSIKWQPKYTVCNKLPRKENGWKSPDHSCCGLRIITTEFKAVLLTVYMRCIYCKRFITSFFNIPWSTVTHPYYYFST